MNITNFLSTIVAILPAIVIAAPTSPNTGLLRRTPGDTSFLYPGGLGDPLNAGFAAKPSSPLARSINRWTTSIPTQCKNQATTLNNGKVRCTPENIDVFEVWFQDSGNRSWVICRCKDSPVKQAVSCHSFYTTNAAPSCWKLNMLNGVLIIWPSLQDLISEIGRIPAGMRQYVRNFMSFNVGSGAFATGGDVIFLGPINPTIVLVRAQDHNVEVKTFAHHHFLPTARNISLR